ncbi:kinase-like domain-containing protein [Mycena olivaceomarginata]|nr:kinase-like domain-containing protein [Mycena olivaceomarginata]
MYAPHRSSAVSNFRQVLDSLPELLSRSRLSKALIRLSRASGLHPTCFPLTDVQIKGKQVAAGAFGDIWKGLVRGQIVAVKTVRLFQDNEVRAAAQEFGREALIWRQLSHPNLLPFFGLHYLDSKICLISPWMSNGHILQFLANAPPDTDRVSLMLDVAMGVEYLHGKHVVHGDLKGMNILVTPSRRACVADFGLSAIVDAMSLRFTHSTASARGGTLRYQAPELHMEQMQNHYGSDVYAFACVCYEIWTGKAPFSEFPRDGMVILKVVEGLRPSRPETRPLDDGLWSLLQDCWKKQFCDRPNASQIVERFVGPAIGARPTDAAVDWDETISSKCRRSLQDWPLLPSITTIENRLEDCARSALHSDAENSIRRDAPRISLHTTHLQDRRGRAIQAQPHTSDHQHVAPLYTPLKPVVPRTRAHSCSRARALASIHRLPL